MKLIIALFLVTMTIQSTPNKFNVVDVPKDFWNTLSVVGKEDFMFDELAELHFGEKKAVRVYESVNPNVKVLYQKI